LNTTKIENMSTFPIEIYEIIVRYICHKRICDHKELRIFERTCGKYKRELDLFFICDIYLVNRAFYAIYNLHRDSVGVRTISFTVANYGILNINAIYYKSQAHLINREYLINKWSYEIYKRTESWIKSAYSPIRYHKRI
jgi:hypothetical protein